MQIGHQVSEAIAADNVMILKRPADIYQRIKVNGFIIMHKPDIVAFMI